MKLEAEAEAEAGPISDVRKEEAQRRRRRRRWCWFYWVSMYVNGTCHDATADVAVAVVAGVRSYWLGRMTKDQKRRLRRVEGVQNSGSGPKEFASGSGRRLTNDERRAMGDERRRRRIRFHACLPSSGGRTEDREATTLGC